MCITFRLFGYLVLLVVVLIALGGCASSGSGPGADPPACRGTAFPLNASSQAAGAP